MKKIFFIPFLFITTKGFSQSEIVVALLHGYGTNSTELVPIKKKLDSLEIKNISINAPFEILQNSKKWFSVDLKKENYFDSKSKALEEAQFSIQFLIKKLESYKNVILIGYSQGGCLAAALGFENSKFKKIILLNSYIIDQICEGDFKGDEILLINSSNDYFISENLQKKTREFLLSKEINFKEKIHSNFHLFTRNEINIILKNIQLWKKQMKNLSK